MYTYKKLLCLLGAGFFLSSANILADERSAIDIMHKAFQHTANMDKYAFKAVIVDHDVQEDGTIIPYTYNTYAKVDRPGNLRVDTKSEFLDRSFYVHNGLYTVIEHGHGYYAQLHVPKTIDKALDSIFTKYDIKAPLASLIYSNMSKRVKFNTSQYFGTMDVAGVKCDYVAFKSKLREVHVWITTGTVPKVKTYSIIDTTTQPNGRTNTSITWLKNPNISNIDFIFTAPKGSKKISILTAN